MSLVLSLFTGLGVLDHGFRVEGFCVVSAGDVIRSALDDVRGFHPPADVFDGVIGGEPCQSHSTLANFGRAKGLEPRFPDLTGEVQRVIEEARPRWFLRENVPGAPDVKPQGYDVRSFLLDHSTLDRGDGTGHEQRRRRRFWFGTRDVVAPELRAFIDFAFFVLPDASGFIGNRPDNTPEAKGRRRAVVAGGGGKRKVTIPGTRSRAPVGGETKWRRASVTARHDGEIGATGGHKGNAPRYSLAEMLVLQQLPENLFEHSPFTMGGKRKLVGNAVPTGMARALARAVRLAMENA